MTGSKGYSATRSRAGHVYKHAVKHGRVGSLLYFNGIQVMETKGTTQLTHEWVFTKHTELYNAFKYSSCTISSTAFVTFILGTEQQDASFFLTFGIQRNVVPKYLSNFGMPPPPYFFIYFFLLQGVNCSTAHCCLLVKLYLIYSASFSERCNAVQPDRTVPLFADAWETLCPQSSFSVQVCGTKCFHHDSWKDKFWLRNLQHDAKTVPFPTFN